MSKSAFAERHRPLEACNFDFRDDGVALCANNGITVYGRAYIEIDDRDGEWYVWQISLGTHGVNPIDKSHPLYADIKKSLEGQYHREIEAACVAAAEVM